MLDDAYFAPNWTLPRQPYLDRLRDLIADGKDHDCDEYYTAQQLLERARIEGPSPFRSCRSFYE
jgi:hypothetical protein